MIWEAIGAIVLFAAGLVLSHRAAWRAGGEAAIEQHRLEQAERRAQHRAETRAAAMGRHRLQPFPDLEPHERPADIGELRALSAAAEAGDLAEIGRQNAAFFRRLALRRWVRAA